MKIKNNQLSVYLNATELSKDINFYGKEVSLVMTSTSNLDVGFKKPINQIYVEIKTPNASNVNITAQRWINGSWANLNIVDQTNGFKNSGFIFFDEDSQTTESNINGSNQFWVRLKVNGNTSGIVLNGINLVFNNLEDLRMEEPSIEKFFPREIQSHIYSIVAARDFILRRINNAQPLNYYSRPIDALKGNYQIDIRNLNQFDIFDVNELRDCSTYYTLYKIFANRSDEADDVYREKATEYLGKFEDTFALFKGRKLTIDLDDNGKEDAADQNNSIRTVKLFR